MADDENDLSERLGEERVNTTNARIDGLRVQVVDVEGQLNRRIETQQRELLDQRRYFEAILVEKDRAVAIADAEREKAASVLRAEQVRSFDVAEKERFKAAEALASSLARSISEGDEHLREHVLDQVSQIEAALVSAEKLAVARSEKLKTDVASVEQRSEMRFDAIQEQVNSRFDYTETAVAKAEAGNEKRFADANQWREQSAERERQQQEQTLRLTSAFLPREVADAQFDQMRRSIADLTEKLGKLA
jgi:hypothetical protein